MRYKKGDKVRVKSLDWYGANKNSEDAIIFEDFHIFDESMSEFCGNVVTIAYCNAKHNYYDIEEDGKVNYWVDAMFEGLVIEEPQEKIVSLDKACDLLYDMLRDQYINDELLVGTYAYDNVGAFIEDFRKTLEL